MANITEWINGKTILLTGGVGFFGKVLMEKLLRSCPEVEKIYLIIRPKFGSSSEDRWNKIIKDKLFENLLENDPDIINRKVVVLSGDMSLINFGLSEDILEELRKTVNIIFHSAATVRFNDPLQKAFLANTRGTLQMCKLASKMDNLECLVHVSTTYCNYNLNKTNYEEKVYEPCQDWRTVLKLIETEDPVTMNIMSKKIVQNHPNTYTFTKSLSEKIVQEYSNKFPAVIARPSVVIGILNEPLPGWTDNLNGVIGVTSGVCKGVIRVLKGRKECSLDYVPVDFAINALITCAWDKATSANKDLSVYNLAYGDFLTTDFGGCVRRLEVNKRITLDNDIWYAFTLFTTNDFYFHILFYLLHFLPAIFLDSILTLLKKKPMLMKITIKIYQAIQALSAFMMNDITFENHKFKELWGRMTDEDIKIFYVQARPEITIIEVMEIMHTGVKVYYFKESLEDIEHHRLKQKRFYYLDRFVRALLICGILRLLYKLLQMVLYQYIL